MIASFAALQLSRNCLHCNGCATTLRRKGNQIQEIYKQLLFSKLNIFFIKLDTCFVVTLIFDGIE